MRRIIKKLLRIVKPGPSRRNPLTRTGFRKLTPWQAIKREIALYLIFRRLSHSQIEALRRQTKLIEAAKQHKRSGKFEYRLALRPDGLSVLEWRRTVA